MYSNAENYSIQELSLDDKILSIPPKPKYGDEFLQLYQNSQPTTLRLDSKMILSFCVCDSYLSYI